MNASVNPNVPTTSFDDTPHVVENRGGDVVENINKNPVFPTTPPHVVENIDHVVENTFHDDVLEDVLEDVLHDIIGGQNTLDDMVTVV